MTVNSLVKFSSICYASGGKRTHWC